MNAMIKNAALAALAIGGVGAAAYNWLKLTEAKGKKVAAERVAAKLQQEKQFAEENSIPYKVNAILTDKTSDLNIAWDKIEQEVVFDPAWKNGTGYFDNIDGAQLDFPAGTVMKCFDEYDRKLFIIVEEDGHHTMVFQRYRDRDDIFAAHFLLSNSSNSRSGKGVTKSAFLDALSQPDQARAILEQGLL